MAKYSERLVDKIVSLIEQDGYTVLEICDILKISRKSFYEWRSTKHDFAQRLDAAIDCRDERLTMKARKSLYNKMDGYCLTESKSTYVPDIIDASQLKLKAHVVKTKEYVPDTSSLRLIMKLDENKRYGMRLDKNESSKLPPLQITVGASETIALLGMLEDKK